MAAIRHSITVPRDEDTAEPYDEEVTLYIELPEED